ncbi:hypothetical protein BDR03DRAFT_959388 [Suillus americanus]|nr:hypothetical protein BDR03DRAFT_959388 [Suillus americanus]
MTANDQAIFIRLNLWGNDNDPKDEPLRRSLGYLPNHIRPHGGESANQFKFVACFRIMMFQKRLQTAQSMCYKFIAGGVSYALFLTRTGHADHHCRTYMVVVLFYGAY